MYISSADFMTRNTERRVEVACPIYDGKVREKIHKIIEAELYDTLKARVLLPDGTYTQKDQRKSPLNSQEYLMEEAEKNAAPASDQKGWRVGFHRLFQRILRR